MIWHVVYARMAVCAVYWRSIGVLVGLFAVCKILQHLLLGSTRAPVDWADVLTLAALGLLAGFLAARGSQRRQETRGAEEQRRAAMESLAAENEAALRVTRAIVRELSQPLSGALSYSEFIMMRAEHMAGFDRCELEGVREGVLQIERLLANLRQTIAVPSAACTHRRIADDVERCVALPRPRIALYNSGACADPSLEPDIA